MVGLLEQMAERLERIEKHLVKCAAPADGDGPFIDQKHSPLGPRRHCAAARRLIAQRDPRAYKNYRLYYLTREAIAEELARISLEPAAPANDGHGEPETAYERAMAKALGARS